MATDASTLVYQCYDDSLPFNHFSLIIRSLHSYKVKSVTSDEPNRSVTVELDYNASIKNVREKLGGVPATVNKKNPYVENCELTQLELLRATYSFGGPSTAEESEAPNPAKKRKYKKSN